jgi:hypothetical protein
MNFLQALGHNLINSPSEYLKISEAAIYKKEESNRGSIIVKGRLPSYVNPIENSKK